MIRQEIPHLQVAWYFDVFYYIFVFFVFYFLCLFCVFDNQKMCGNYDFLIFKGGKECG
jgi:hypothetical protein